MDKFLYAVRDLALCVILLMLVAAALSLLTGCGSERDTQTRQVEKLEMSTGPLIVDTPIGQFTAQPVRHTMVRTEDTVEREEKRVSMPEVGQIMQSAPALAGPLGIIGTLAGLATTAGAGWLAARRGRRLSEETDARAAAETQRDEIIDGIESTKHKLSQVRVRDDQSAWDLLTVDLERKQSADTIAAVKARVG